MLSFEPMMSSLYSCPVIPLIKSPLSGQVRLLSSHNAQLYITRRRLVMDVALITTPESGIAWWEVGGLVAVYRYYEGRNQ